MSRVNPIYIVVLLLLFLVIVIYQNGRVKEQIIKGQQELKRVEEVGGKVAKLKEYWKEKKRQKQRIESLLHLSFIKKYITQKEERRNRYFITLDNVKSVDANKIINKVLNRFIKISRLNIERKSDKSVKIELELKL